jgi:hypothetical protein
LVGASGIVLNYKKPTFTALGLEGKPPNAKPGRDAGADHVSVEFTTSTGAATMPVQPERALEIARAQWGEVLLEKLELKTEHGEMICKLKRKGGEELWVNAVSGEHFIKGEYEKIFKGGTATTPARQTDWGKILIDLHTGKIGGEVGKALKSESIFTNDCGDGSRNRL